MRRSDNIKIFLLILFAFICLLGMFATDHAQCPTMPAGTFCLTQEQANKVAENKRELDATKAKVDVLQQALLDKDTIIGNLKDTNEKNTADLKVALHDTEVKLATSTGQLIEMQADRVRWTAVIDVLIKSTRKKSIGLIAF